MDIVISGEKIHAVDIQLQSEKIKIKNDFSVLINGAEEEKPVYMHNVKILQLSQFMVKVELFGFILKWTSNDDYLEIVAEPVFSDRIFGLCGTFNWNQKVLSIQ